MLLFLDTEFTDFTNPELISIGMVSEDGQHELYLEIQDFDREGCSRFVQTVVWPLLGRFDGASVKKVEIKDRLLQWFATLPRSVVVARDSQFDQDLLGRMLGGAWPENFAGWYDLRPLVDTTVFDKAAERHHGDCGEPAHHALYDARAHRAGWLAWHDQRRRQRLDGFSAVPRG